MDKRRSLTLTLELLWWVVTLLVVLAVLYPIRRAMHVWPFEGWNIAFIVLVITMGRYIFLIPHTFLAKRQVLKVALLLLMFPTIFILINGLNKFLVFIEENTWEPLTGHLPLGEQKAMEKYLWGEMIFFGMGSIICAPILAVRLLISIWRTHNRGTA